ncbi:MAG TPA: DUF433 domain-containing protein [Planctomycetaceae bacterium]|nr:DUF433 domain-containing protein [Planctomycetaceae bacterium]
MPNIIIDRGRGPKVKGTRVTVYRIMDYLREGSDAERIARELFLTDEQVRAAIEYIQAHESELTAEYERIIARPRANPAWVEAACAKSVEELKLRIMTRRKKHAAHADPRG